MTRRITLTTSTLRLTIACNIQVLPPASGQFRVYLTILAEGIDRVKKKCPKSALFRGFFRLPGPFRFLLLFEDAIGYFADQTR